MPITCKLVNCHLHKQYITKYVNCKANLHTDINIHKCNFAMKTLRIARKIFVWDNKWSSSDNCAVFQLCEKCKWMGKGSTGKVTYESAD